ncbi:MAG: SRPBCC family protein [Bacteroidota bacterium]|nr:SRPBCC family protein [Bacteroidota bacterium]
MKSDISVKVSAVINRPISDVWEALTKPEIIKQYFFGADTITDWRIGGSIVFKGEWEGRSYEDKGIVLRFETNKILQYNYWSSMSGIEDTPENYVTISYFLSSENGKTSLTISQENIPNEKMKEHSGQNWKKVLNSLKILLEQGVKEFNV